MRPREIKIILDTRISLPIGDDIEDVYVTVAGTVVRDTAGDPSVPNGIEHLVTVENLQICAMEDGALIKEDALHEYDLQKINDLLIDEAAAKESELIYGERW